MKKILLFLALMFGMFQQVSADSQDNIQYHLKLVENVLREVDTSDLTEEQKNNRLEKLDILSDYTAYGEFPNNDIDSELTSIFRGSNGNLCAVGYLMYSDPEYRDYVDDIVSSENLIRVMTIQDDPIFQKWSEENGFSQIELAMIQPSYPPEPEDHLINIKIMISSGFYILIFLVLLSTVRGVRKKIKYYLFLILSPLYVFISLFTLSFYVGLIGVLTSCSYYVYGGMFFPSSYASLSSLNFESESIACHYLTDNISYNIQIIGFMIFFITLSINIIVLMYYLFRGSHFKLHIKMLIFNSIFLICLGIINYYYPILS